MNPDNAPVKARRSKLKVLAARLVVLFFSLLVCLLLLELGVRIFLPYYNPSSRIVYHINPDGVSLGRPNTTIHHGTPKGDFQLDIWFNQYGLRDAKDLKNSTTNDFFAVGDSFTMGWGVTDDERFSGALQKKLGRPVYNVASPENILGYARLLDYARQHGAQVRNLVIGICMENDLRDYRDGRTTADLMRDSAPRGWGIHFNPRQWLLYHSAAYTAFTYLMQKSPAIRGALEKLGLSRKVEADVYRNLDSEEVLQSSAQAVVGIATNYHTVVLVIPSRGLWTGDNTEVEKKVHARFTELLRAAELDVVDPKARLEAGGNPLGYYFKSDPHWRATGHEVAAEELYRFFQTHSNWLNQVH